MRPFHGPEWPGCFRLFSFSARCRSAPAALPISAGGLGVRETASLALLSLFGITASDAVAASLLTTFTGFCWAAFGGLLFLREERLFCAKAEQPLPKTISVVIATFNEAKSLPQTIPAVKALPQVAEVIVVDGGSRDETLRIAEELGCRVLSGPASRGGQMRLGASQAQGDVVWLLHADTSVPPNAGQAIIESLRDPSIVAGGCWKVFSQPALLMRGSRIKCAVRLFVGRRVAGDQAMFIRRDVLEAIGGVPDVPLMEEFELCRLLRPHGRLALADTTLVTSSRRFLKHGVLRTYLRMWKVMILYFLGTTPVRLKEIYERE
jgi:rSAM/selenodomain-associated transferase 2